MMVKKAKNKEDNTENLKIAIMKAASMALEYKQNNPHADSDDVVAHVLSCIDEQGNAKICAIAAASKAIECKLRKQGTDKEIIQRIMREGDDIIASTVRD